MLKAIVVSMECLFLFCRVNNEISSLARVNVSCSTLRHDLMHFVARKQKNTWNLEEIIFSLVTPREH